MHDGNKHMREADLCRRIKIVQLLHLTVDTTEQNRLTLKMNLFKAFYMVVLFGLASLNVLAEGNGAWW